MKTETTIATETKEKNEGLAAVLSLLIPGLGQIYNGHFIWAIFWMILTPGFWIGSLSTLGFTGVALHVLASIHAYRQAVKKNYLLTATVY